MRSINPKYLVSFIALIISFQTLVPCLPMAWAEEEAAPAGEASAGQEIPKDQKEFTEKTGRLNVLKNHIEEADKKFAELVEEKHEAKTALAKQDVIKQMYELNKQRNLDAIELNKVKNDLTYRYPDLGDRLNKTYRTQDKRSLEEMEGAAGLDELLTRTKKQVDKKYAPFLKDQPEAKRHGRSISIQTDAVPKHEDEAPRLRLEK